MVTRRKFLEAAGTGICAAPGFWSPRGCAMSMVETAREEYNKERSGVSAKHMGREKEKVYRNEK